MKKVLVIDAQGGGIGKQVVSEIIKKEIDVEIIAVGTNASATAVMIKAGATHGATGENPVLVCSRDADFIIGPIGIVIADSMYGEITPNMAKAIGQSSGKKLLIPVNSCGNYVVGMDNKPMKEYIMEAVNILAENCDN